LRYKLRSVANILCFAWRSRKFVGERHKQICGCLCKYVGGKRESCEIEILFITRESIFSLLYLS